MKTMKYLIGAASAAVLVASLAASPAQAAIDGSLHDLGSLTTLGTTNAQICVSCHTPHNANATQLAPLWNRTSSTATFSIYTSDTLDTTPGQPGGVSLACLSCHDGTIALSSMTNNPQLVTFTAPAAVMTGGALLGNDLRDDHPITIAYPAVVAEFNQPDGNGYVNGELPIFSTGVECASCHNPHDNTIAPFLRKANTNSGLCTTCHNK